MQENQSHSADKSRRKWPWIVLGSLVLLAIILRLALMTPPVHRWAKSIIIKQANAQLVPSLSIGSLSGDLWDEVTLTNIALSRGDSTVASVDTLSLSYNLFSYFSDALKVQHLHISHPFLAVKQQKDSTFNVQHWLVSTDTDTSSAAFAISIADLSITQGRVEVSLPNRQADSSISIRQLNLGSAMSYYGDTYSVNLSKLDFIIEGTRLSSPVSVSTEAKADEKNISLEKLAIATAHSMLQAKGSADLQDSSGSFRAEADPLGWQDIVAYADSLPVKKNMELNLGVSGSPQKFKLSLTANAEGINQLQLKCTLKRDSTFSLTSASVSAPRLDLAAFLGDTTMPSLQNVEIQVNGSLPLADYQQGSLRGTLSADHIRQGSYRADAVTGTFSINSKEARLRLTPMLRGEKLIAEAHVLHPWQEKPSVTATIKGQHINPLIWMPGSDYSGDVSFSGEVRGEGWYPQQTFWNYRLSIDQSSMIGQPLDGAVIAGRFNRQQLTNQTAVKLGKGSLQLVAEAHNLSSVPTFSYTLDVQTLNLSKVTGFEAYPSSITGTLHGNGMGSALQNLKLQASVKIDSSVFRGETIKNFSFDASLGDSVASLKSGVLASSIADGSFKGRFLITDPYDLSNRLHLNLKIKDISSLASLAGADVLRAVGTVEGDVMPAAKDSLSFKGSVDLKDINYNQAFTAQKVTGNAKIMLNKNPGFDADLHIKQPVASSVQLQDVALKTKGVYADSLFTGSFKLVMNGEEEGKIIQAGSYTLKEDTISAAIDTLDLLSSKRALSIIRPFHLSFAHGTLHTDTLRLHGKDDNAMFRLAIPHADSLQQRAFFKARNLNLSAIQQALFNKAYVGGSLFGEARLMRTDTTLAASGDLLIANMAYNETKLDTLHVQADVKDERLTSSLLLRKDGKTLVKGDADIPFVLKHPGKLNDSFFQQPVHGHISVEPLELKQFSTLLDQAGLKNTEGIFQFNGSLEGQAGQPRVDASLSLKKAKLSGVPVDSLTASMHYAHDDSEFTVDAQMTSLGQKTIIADARAPLKVDLSDLDVSLPGPEDSVTINIKANAFKLKSLNGLVNRNMLRNLEGELDGNVHISGPRNNLQSTGQLALKGAAVRVVDAGIRVDHINSILQFEPDSIVLQRFDAKSGSGSFSAQGKLGIKELVPGSIDIKAKAKNFKLANTDNYNGIINMDMQVSGTVTRPKISGKLDVVNGFVELSNFGQKSVEDVQLDTTVATKYNTSMYDSLSLDMTVQFNRRFFVRNQRYLKMEIELDGSIDLEKKAGKDLQLFGTLSTTKGYAEPLGKRFQLEEGSLAFSGPPDNPQLDIRTLYEPPQKDQDIKIYYIIKGTVEDPQFKYESTPKMDLSSIISYTLFGQPFYKLNPAEQGVASSSGNNVAADFAMEVLMDRLESLATRRLGIDVVRIDNTRVGGKTGTSITTGWYINPKVFFAIQNVITGSTPTTGFYLEYYLKKNLKLILNQGNNNRQGVDVQWEYDY